MKGLLIKDLMMTKKHGAAIILCCIIFFVISAFSKSVYLSFYASALISLIVITIMAFDEAYRWTKYEAVLPVSKKSIVLEKYLLVLIICAPVIIIQAIFYPAVFGYGFADTAELIAVNILCAIISPSIIFPIIFKFGYIKAKAMNIVLIALIATVTGISAKFTLTGDVLIEGSLSLNTSIVLIFLAVSVLIYTTSILLSIRLYKSKEF